MQRLLREGERVKQSTMRRLVRICIGLTAVAITVFAFLYLRERAKPRPEGMPAPAPVGEGWVNLLDSDHAPHWENVTDDKELFEIQSEVLHIFGRTIYPLRYVAYTGEKFGDFDLHLEFKVARGANSGVFLRMQPESPDDRGFEVQILDDHGKAPTRTRTGAIYDVVTPMFNLSRPAGEWNSYDIRLRGTEVKVILNGWKVIDTDFARMTERIGKFSKPYADMPAEGRLALQDHGGEVWFRNIFIRKH